MWAKLLSNESPVKAAVGVHDSIYRDSSESFRELISPDEVVVPKSLPRILLVDDDPTFGKIMKRSSQAKGIDIVTCSSVEEFSQLKNWDFDVIIMDYDLGAVTGFELTSYMEQYTEDDLPVILVSQTKQNDPKTWPTTIREFVHKSLGPFAILDAAFEAHEVNLMNMANVTSSRFNGGIKKGG